MSDGSRENRGNKEGENQASKYDTRLFRITRGHVSRNLLFGFVEYANSSDGKVKILKESARGQVSEITPKNLVVSRSDTINIEVKTGSDPYIIDLIRSVEKGGYGIEIAEVPEEQRAAEDANRKETRIIAIQGEATDGGLKVSESMRWLFEKNFPKGHPLSNKALESMTVGEVRTVPWTSSDREYNDRVIGAEGGMIVQGAKPVAQRPASDTEVMRIMGGSKEVPAAAPADGAEIPAALLDIAKMPKPGKDGR